MLGEAYPERINALIAALGTIPLLVLPFMAAEDAANYKYSFIFLVPIIWGVFFLRRSIHLHPFQFALFVLAVILHDLGALGYYRRVFFGLAFDTYVHFYFSLAGALVLERAFREGTGLRGGRVWVTVVLFLLGLGAIHELVELGSTLVLGEEGMYQMNDSVDPLDTHKDLFNDLLGSLAGLSLSAVHRRVRGARTAGARA